MNWLLPVVFLILTVAIAISGYVYYQKQKKAVINEQIAQLKAIADLKAVQIRDWLRERIGDSHMIQQNPIMVAELAAFLGDRSRESRKNAIQRWMESLQRNYHYENVLLLNRQGEPVLAASPQHASIGSEGLKNLEAARRRRDTVLSDLHSAPHAPYIHMDTVTPLVVENEIAGFVFLRINPLDFLFPMIQSWPTPSPSAETLLVKREGEEVVYLNELRHRQGAALTLRLPLHNVDLPAAMAVLGKAGITAGYDYRGVAVRSVNRSIPDTPWFIVAKIDREEIEQPVRRSAQVIFLVALLLLLAATLTILFLWQRQQNRYRLHLLELHQESEEKFKQVFETANVGKSITQLSGEINVNKAFCDMLGYSPEEFGRIKWQEITPDDEIETIQKILEPLLQGQQDAARFTKRYIRKDGAIVWGDISVAIKRDPAGKPLHFITTVVDITERKQAEKNLQRLSERNQAMLEAIPDIIMEVDKDKVYTWANHAGSEFFGDAVIGKEANHYFEGEQKTYQLVKPLFNGHDEIIYVESWQRRRDGQKRLLAWWCRVLKDESGKVTGALSSGRDITEIRRAEDALRESERKFRETIVNLDEGYYNVTVDGILLEHNQAFNRILGFDSGKNLKGTHMPDFWQNPEDRQVYVRELSATGAISNYQINAKTQQKENITVLASAHLVKGEDDQPQRIEGVFMDISQRIRTELEIQRLNEELEQRVLQRTSQLEAANKELEAFSYSVSHDLRAPLRAIDGFSRIVVEEYASKLDNEGRRLLGVITANTRKMAHLIDDLLAFSRLSRQQMAAGPVNLAVMARIICAEFKNQEKGRLIEFKVAAQPLARGDYSMLQQVLQNLLANAVKFTRTRPRARIEFSGKAGPSENIYCIKDNGVGFDMQFVDKLFGVFQRLHSADEFEGTGVGLAIVQRIVVRHGGRVWAESSASGATFYFSLPTDQGLGSRG